MKKSKAPGNRRFCYFAYLDGFIGFAGCAGYADYADFIGFAGCCVLRSPASADAFNSGRYAEHNGRLNHVTSRSLVESQPCNALLRVS